MRRGLKHFETCASTTTFPPTEEVEGLIKEVNKSATQASVAEKVKAIERQIDDVKNPAMNFWTLQLLEAIDDVAKNQFAQCPNAIGTADDMYLSALARYTSDVENKMRGLNRTHPNLETTVARFKWLMRPRIDEEDTPIPFVTGWVFEAISNSLARTPEAWKEVSHTLNPCTRRTSAIALVR